ncbi:hypothetical protein AMQ83_10405 [Paenibacillus riograndensis]|nr:hypothetical protein AMQ83_10405 [Paenibacillus riograndensis]
MQVPILFETRIYGLAVLQHMVEDIHKKKNDGNTLDIRAYHLQYEHKKCMVLMLSYMIDHSYLLSGEECLTNYKKLTSEVLLLRNFVIKYNLTRKLNFLDNIEQRLINILKTETQIIDELLEKLI